MTAALVLLSALLHAGWNTVLRGEPDKPRAVVVAVGLASALAGLVALVQGATGTAAFPTTAALGFTLAAGAFEAVYVPALARGLTAGPLGPVYTISRGGSVVLVWPLSVLLLAEAPGWQALVGSAVVLVGLAMAGASRGTPARAVAWAALCAGCIAGYHLCYKAALADGGAPAAVFALSLGGATLVNLVGLGRAGRAAAGEILRRRTGRSVLAGLMCGLGFLLFVRALADGGAGVVLSLRNTSVVFATVLGLVVGDRPTRLALIGAVVVAAGGVLITLAQ